MSFLTVDHQKPSVVYMYVRGQQLTYRLHKCLPEQRDAHRDVSRFFKDVCEMEQCKEDPFLFRAVNPELQGDILAVG